MHVGDQQGCVIPWTVARSCATGILCRLPAGNMLSAALPGLELLLCVIFATLLTEVLLWFWAYRFNSFKSLKVAKSLILLDSTLIPSRCCVCSSCQLLCLQVQLEKQGKRLESMKSSNQGYGKKTKKADRLELQLKEQVTKALASLRLKQAVVVSNPEWSFKISANRCSATSCSS